MEPKSPISHNSLGNLSKLLKIMGRILGDQNKVIRDSLILFKPKAEWPNAWF